EPELVKVRAEGRVRPGRRRRWREAWADGRRLEPAHDALLPAARLLARRRTRRVLAQAWIDPVGIAPPSLLRLGRRDVVVEPAVLIVREEENRIVPAAARPQRRDDVRYEGLAQPDVGGRMFVGFDSRDAESRIDERDGGQGAGDFGVFRRRLDEE